jgi:hypothetical protein
MFLRELIFPDVIFILMSLFAISDFRHSRGVGHVLTLGQVTDILSLCRNTNEG